MRKQQAEPELQIELQLKNEGQDKFQDSDFVFSLNIGEIENIYSVEEGLYYENVQAAFDQN